MSIAELIIVAEHDAPASCILRTLIDRLNDEVGSRTEGLCIDDTVGP